MKMRPLIITSDVEKQAAACVAYAELHRYSLRDVFDLMRKKISQPGNDPQRVVYVPMGYRCVFDIEQQEDGWCRHLSVSVWPAEPGDFPSPDAVEYLLPLFGFAEGGLKGVHCMNVDEITNDGRGVINLVSFIDPEDFCRAKARADRSSMMTSPHNLRQNK